ncbi:MAG: hypothetical protein LUF04_15855 [Bacteroides sp.]|nr:hypothetical protein [Bacteroides sp.]
MKTVCQKAALFLAICATMLRPAVACGPDYDPGSYYYNLFLQEIVEDEPYKPFLFISDAPFYPMEKSRIRNENIEEWQEYLGIPYEDARYLVFEADTSAIRNLMKGVNTEDPQLEFIRPAFLKKYRQALEYILCAKELEPYMHILPSEDSWYYSPDRLTVGDLDYEEVASRLKTGWKRAKDNELRLRYGYQLVRLAHYNRRYEEATELFDTYVESLNYRPAMYYHALSQKAGAEKGMGASSLANYHFLQVFVHSKNLKETAVLSMRINEDPDWEDLIGRTKNQQELNDAYLLLGYHSFNNPLREIAKIVENDPDAIQARILMVRAIHQIERNDLPVYYTAYSYGQDKERQGDETDKRYPIATSLTDEIIDLSDEMTRHPAVKDRNFWLMTSAYLHFLNKEFARARHYLEQVEEENETYTLQKMNLAFYIDICEPDTITAELEMTLYETYTQLLIQSQALQGEAWYHSDTQAFVRDVWANRTTCNRTMPNLSC